MFEPKKDDPLRQKNLTDYILLTLEYEPEDNTEERLVKIFEFLLDDFTPDKIS